MRGTRSIHARRTLRTFAVTGTAVVAGLAGAASAQASPTATNITTTSVDVCSGLQAPSRMIVRLNSSTVASGIGTCFTVANLTPNTSYTFSVSAGAVPAPDEELLAQGNVTATTLASTPTLVNYAYGLTGAATLKTLVKGSLPLKGRIDAKLDVASGAFTAALALDQTTVNLVALGVLPVTATVAINSTEPVTGTLKDGILTANAKVRIKLPVVKLFGVQIGGGASCQAKQISSIALKSTANPFRPLVGGPIAGTFSISDLAGCGALNGIISPLTAGKGNAIVLNLTPTT